MSGRDYTISSGNVFADAELPDAEECLTRAELQYYITTEISRRGLTEHQAASITGNENRSRQIGELKSNVGRCGMLDQLARY